MQGLRLPVSSRVCIYIRDLFFFFFNIYYFERERQSVSGGGADSKGDTESEAGSRLRAVSTEPDAGAQTHKL